jgi:UDP-glucose 4-epimerase
VNALVTGGAGFIGSHLADGLLLRGHQVRVLDDLSNATAANVPRAADLVRGDVVDLDVVRAALDDVDVVFHQAALGSVQRSIETPLETDRVNVHGTLTVLEAARQAGVRRVVAASSSSIYGGVGPLPTSESFPPLPRSPYAVSKISLEQYCRVYTEMFGLETICLRYFNVYGPRQRSDSSYAAVIPLFIAALRAGERPLVHGDGLQTRDFTYVEDAVQANLLAADAPSDLCSGRVFNIGGGHRHTLLSLLKIVLRELEVEALPLHIEARAGDVRDSQADISAARSDLGYEPRFSLEEGIARTIAYTRGPLTPS